jgi:hypothetical protein
LSYESTFAFDDITNFQEKLILEFMSEIFMQFLIETGKRILESVKTPVVDFRREEQIPFCLFVLEMSCFTVILSFLKPISIVQ